MAIIRKKKVMDKAKKILPLISSYEIGFYDIYIYIYIYCGGKVHHSISQIMFKYSMRQIIFFLAYVLYIIQCMILATNVKQFSYMIKVTLKLSDCVLFRKITSCIENLNLVCIVVYIKLKQ